MFKQNKLSTAIVAVLASVAGNQALAQEEAPAVEEVVVTGIRASVQAAMDIKRESAGVVDAISAEDMGKFPDTNLAESLQRITGVSISRTNGEGSQITVRGFGPDNNMVTLNGRNMPSATTYGGSSGADGTTRGGSSRAFDFANLASEAVSGVEVYKTGKASIATGGIGATINIKTTRPLDNPGLNASVGLKGVMDTTNRTGDDITPELSGLVSWSDDNDMFGVSLSASFQERHSGYTGATVNDWNIGVWDVNDETNGEYNLEDYATSPVFVNPPAQGQLYARPNDIRYAYSDTQRARTNAQLTLQFSPSEKFVSTVDFTMAQNEIEEHRGEVTNWVQNGTTLTEVVFDDQVIATPISITENYGGGSRDIGFEQQYRSQENTLESVGINLEFLATDSLTLKLDVHDSSMESLPTGPGGTGELAVGLGAPVKAGKTLHFGGELPYWTYADGDINDCIQRDATLASIADRAVDLDDDGNLDTSNDVLPGDAFQSNCDGVFDAADISSSVMRMYAAEQTSDITEVRIDGELEFDNGRFDFGIQTRDMSSNTQSYNTNNNQVLGGWGADNPGEFPEGMIEPFDVTGEFDDFDTGGAPNIGFRADARELAAHLVTAPQYASQNPYIGLNNDGRNTANINNTVDEETVAAYFQLSLEGQLGPFETRLLTGLRYETTDVTSSSRVQPVGYLEWQSDNDFSAVSVGDVVVSTETSSYDNLLPSLDVDVSFTDELTGRFSFSKTIARAGLGSLAVASSGFGTTGATLNGATPSATGSNPGLLPLESSNFDLSLEWYFADTSYVSGGLFEKRVVNFVGTGQEDRTHFEIRDTTNGPRAIAARDALLDGGFSVDDASLHAMMVILGNPDDFANGADDFDGTQAQITALNEGDPEGAYNLDAQSDDPLTVFQTSIPVNNREAKIHGAELAVQHFFGESGFGVMANYTIVRGDVNHNDEALPTEQQFALLGLSDTANLVAMFEKFGFQARLAYNWRDEYLNRTNYKSGGNNPGYIEAYSQFDLNVSYEILEGLSVSFEGLNITGEDSREHGRNNAQLWYLEDLGPRYQIGARYTF